MSTHESDPSRRLFLKEAGTAAVVLLTREGLTSPARAQDAPATPVRVGVIGTGRHGQLLLSNLSRVPGAQIVALCDPNEMSLKKAQEIAPNATAGGEYRKLLEQSVEAVVVATPTHLHKDIVLAAIQADKHVYCEAPLAVSIDEATAIARAGAQSKKVFQVGLHSRGSQVYRHALKFIRSGVLDRIAQARAQYHKKETWRRAAAPQQEREQNWKLYQATSLGLVGEIGTHQIDVVSWYLRRTPTAVIGYGAVKLWDDGREVHDTVQCLFEYPNGVQLTYDATIANSFGGSYEVLTGSLSAVMTQGERAWIIKEADSPVLGWEVYARKDKIGDDEGIALVADATKLIAQGKDPAKFAEEARAGKNAYFDSLDEFLNCIRKSEKPTAGALEGLQSTVVAIKANQAVWSGSKVVIPKEAMTLPEQP